MRLGMSARLGRHLSWVSMAVASLLVLILLSPRQSASGAAGASVDGSYRGQYSGDDSGSVAFSISGSNVTVTQPGSGSGSVSGSSINISSGNVTISGFACDFEGEGTVTVGASGQGVASGTWEATCEYNSRASGKWQATRPAPSPSPSPSRSPSLSPSPSPTPTPSPSPTGAPNEVADVEGEATLTKADGTEEPLTSGHEFEPGDSVATGTSPATVGLADGSKVALDEDSSVTWAAATELVQKKGRLFFSILTRERRWKVTTIHAVAGVRGTVFTTDVTGGVDRIQVYEGSVEVGPDPPDDTSVVVNAEFETVCAPEAPCTQPERFSQPLDPFWAPSEFGYQIEEDGNDSPGQLDIKRAALGYHDGRFALVVEIAEPRLQALAWSTPNYIWMDFDSLARQGNNYYSGSRSPSDFYAWIKISRDGNSLVGKIARYKRGPDVNVGTGVVEVLDSRTVRMTFDSDLINASGSVRWFASARFRNRARCSKSCWDYAPNRGLLFYRIPS